MSKQQTNKSYFFCIQFESAHTWESWKDHFRRSGKEYITKKILQLQRDRERISNFKKALGGSSTSKNNNDPLQPVAGPSGINSRNKKRRRETTSDVDVSEEEEEEEEQKSNKRTAYKEEDKHLLAKALRKAELRRNTITSVYKKMSKKVCYLSNVVF